MVNAIFKYSYFINFLKAKLLFFHEKHAISYLSNNTNHPSKQHLESAKLRALRAHVLTYLAHLRAYVPCVLMCSCATMLCVFTSQRVLRVHVPTYLACLRAHVPTCFVCLRAHMLMCYQFK